MSLKEADSTQYWKTIPKKCKNCSKAIYTIEDGVVLYQCSLFGQFQKNCKIETTNRKLPSSKEILNGNI